MKKFLAVIIAAVMVVSIVSAIVIAYEAPGDDGTIAVAYAGTDEITIDGTISEGEWPEANTVTLTSHNLVSWSGSTFEGSVDFTTAWNENGLYIAAEITDDIGVLAASGVGTRLQLALNPGAIIASNYPGLFFSFVPYVDEDVVHVYRHNWRSNADEAYDAADDDGYEGKYTETDTGWIMECVLPWSMIATADRTAALNAENIPLTEFDPAAEDAICTAMICYIPCDASTKDLATGRTGENTADWNVSAYDVTFTFLAQAAAPDDSGADSGSAEESGEIVDPGDESDVVSDDNHGEDSDVVSDEGSDVVSDEGSDVVSDEGSDSEPEIEIPDNVEAKDVNGDGEIDNKDVVVLFRFVSGSEGAKEIDLEHGDINGDNEVNNKDVVILFRLVSKK